MTYNTDILQSIKNRDLKIIKATESLLHYAGYKSFDTLHGKSDFDLPWQDYAHLYCQHELDALNNKVYSAMILFKDHLGNDYLFCHTKKPIFDPDSQEIIGVRGLAINITSKQNLPFIKMLKYGDTNVLKLNQQDDLLITEKEHLILFYLLRGKTAKMIGKLLNISHRTIEKHIEHIKLKLDCRNKEDLTTRCVELGLYNILPGNAFTQEFLRTIDDV